MKILKYILCMIVLVTIISCSEDTPSTLRNDYIMKTMAPAIAGETLEFAYAMGTQSGSLVSATAEVSIAGVPGTGFDAMSYHTDSRGNDVGVTVADTSTVNAISTAVFSTDTNAATLRYSYIVPSEAKGQAISITFKSESSAGEMASINTPQYRISKMDLVRDVQMSNADIAYFSLETMQAYTEAEVIAQGLSDKIDLIYIYEALSTDGYIYGHSLVSPGAEEKYLNGRVLPAGFIKNKTKIEKQVFIRDMQLSGEVPATYIDDIDLETLDLTNAADFILGIKTNNSAFVESEDGRYKAYLYFNLAKSRKLTFGIKRYEMK